MYRPLLFCLVISCPQFAWAQSAPISSADVARSADDAFGRRIGIEDVGLYSETEVRGFNLQDAGNYRIEDHYYVRATGLPVAVSDGTLIRVGVNGLRTDFAAPSGVVQYDLPTASEEPGGTLEAGWWPGAGPTMVARVTPVKAMNGLSMFVGGQFNPWQAYNDGTTGTYGALGLVPRWRPAPGMKISAVAMANRFKRESDTGFLSPGGTPDRVRRNYNRTQPWMQSRTDALLGGIFGEAELGSWQVAASTFVSQSKDLYSAFNLFVIDDSTQRAEARVILSPTETYRSSSSELKASHTGQMGALKSRVYAAARLRRSSSRTSPGLGLVLGDGIDLDEVPKFERPDRKPPSVTGLDQIRQWSLGAGYLGSLGDRAELRFDVQKVRYHKRSAQIDAPDRREVSTPWLYSGSLAVAATSQLTIFATHARGLEEAGTAPSNASNRGEVLPAGLSRQTEFGMRFVLPGGPSVIGGLFDITKPLPGLNGGVYSYVGEVRHRGLEVSLTGEVAPSLHAVVGATLLQARVSGALVERGEIGSRPVGRPAAAGLATLSWDVPGASKLTIDGGVSFRGERPANSANSESLPAYAMFNLGLRQGFQIRAHDFTLRARVGNLLNTFAWSVNNSGLFTPNGPRTFTLTLTGNV